MNHTKVVFTRKIKQSKRKRVRLEIKLPSSSEVGDIATENVAKILSSMLLLADLFGTFQVTLYPPRGTRNGQALGNNRVAVLRTNGAVVELVTKVKGCNKQISLSLREDPDSKGCRPSDSLEKILREKLSLDGNQFDQNKHWQTIQRQFEDAIKLQEQDAETAAALELAAQPIPRRQPTLVSDDTNQSEMIAELRAILKERDEEIVSLERKVSKLERKVSGMKDNLAALKIPHWKQMRYSMPLADLLELGLKVQAQADKVLAAIKLRDIRS